jgi:SAM-dependent methyltransferase
MTTSPAVLDDLLCCPTCRGSLQRHDRLTGEQHRGTDPGGGYRCDACGNEYPIVSGVPDLVPPSLDIDADWALWSEHLEAFQRRRDARVDASGGVAGRLSRLGRPQQEAFAEFTGIRDGVVLDIGCGPGKFRRRLPDSVHYVGLDPIPLPGVSEFDFVRAVAENIPLRDGAVQHITILSALDHFRDLDRFVAEARRVLGPDGRLHIVQQVHESHWSVRGLAHWLKDAIDDRTTKHDDEVPHHMTEFGQDELRAVLDGEFDIVHDELYSIGPFAPRRWFVTAAPVTD